MKNVCAAHGVDNLYSNRSPLTFEGLSNAGTLELCRHKGIITTRLEIVARLAVVTFGHGKSLHQRHDFA